MLCVKNIFTRTSHFLLFLLYFLHHLLYSERKTIFFFLLLSLLIALASFQYNAKVFFHSRFSLVSGTFIFFVFVSRSPSCCCWCSICEKCWHWCYYKCMKSYFCLVTHRKTFYFCTSSWETEKWISLCIVFDYFSLSWCRVLRMCVCVYYKLDINTIEERR